MHRASLLSNDCQRRVEVPPTPLERSSQEINLSAVFLLFPRFYFVHVVCSAWNALAHILRGLKYRIHFYHYNTYVYSRVLTDALFTACIYIILFSPKRRWRRGAFERSVRKNCASSAFWFSGGTRGSGLL